MKVAKFAGAAAINLECPDCGGACFDLENQSYMITSTQEEVQCEDCGNHYKVPTIKFFNGKKLYRTKRIESQI